MPCFKVQNFIESIRVADYIYINTILKTGLFLRFNYINSKNAINMVRLSKFDIINKEKIFLKKLKNQQEIQSWKEISKIMNKTFPQKPRTPKQYRQKYINYLQFSPQIDIKQWSFQQSHLLLEKYLQYGPKWKILSQFFQQRSENYVKNKFNCCLRKISRKLNLKCQIIKRLFYIFQINRFHPLHKFQDLKNQILQYSLFQTNLTESQIIQTTTNLQIFNRQAKFMNSFKKNRHKYGKNKQYSEGTKNIANIQDIQSNSNQVFTHHDKYKQIKINTPHKKPEYIPANAHNTQNIEQFCHLISQDDVFVQDQVKQKQINIDLVQIDQVQRFYDYRDTLDRQFMGEEFKFNHTILYF